MTSEVRGGTARLGLEVPGLTTCLGLGHREPSMLTSHHTPLARAVT